MSTNEARTNWLVFVALGFFWGSSYLFIKLGVDAGLTPFTLVALRLFVGSILLGSVVFVAHERLPRDPRMYLKIAFLGIFAIALPFVLITIAEQHVPSSLAATLTAPVPLFAILFSAALLAERITPAKIVGIIVGLIGVAVLMGFDVTQLGTTDLTFQLVLVGAAVSYGFGGVYARRWVTGLRPMVVSFIEVGLSMLMVGAAALVFENPARLIGNMSQQGLVSIIWLGIFGSGLAYLAFFRLLDAWGPTRTALVAYLLPVWGIALGLIVLGEALQSGLILGTALVILGIAFVNTRPQAMLIRARQLRARFGTPAPEATAPETIGGPR